VTETTHPRTARPAAHRTPARRLVAAGVVAGPVYVLTWLVQAAVRDGFDLTRHAASVLANGPGGWVQVANFLVTGALTASAGIGLARVDPGQRWVGRGLVGYGVGLVLSGLFRADPGAGFPPGAPGTTVVSWHGILHLVLGSLGFVGFVVATLAAGRLSRRREERGWHLGSLTTGVVFLAAFVGIASGGGSRVSIVAFSVAVVGGWVWLTAWSLHTGANPRQEQEPAVAGPPG
jgi:hypothetical membrane protein